MRYNDHIPNYLLEADGTVINRETGEIESKINATEYRLQTSEKVFLETKNKTIELVRRFTDGQIRKLYEGGTEYNSVSENTGKTKVSQDGPNLGQGVYINGTRFESLRQASEQLQIGKSTIDRRIKSDDFPTYFKIE